MTGWSLRGYERAQQEPDGAGRQREGPLDGGYAEAGLAMLIEASERAVEEAGSSVPPAQIRALLVIDRAGSLNLTRLAEALGASQSAASRLCDRIEASGLLTRDRTAASRREVMLFPTESGRRLAEWVRGRRRAALGDVLEAMSTDGRDALVKGLRELAASAAARVSAESRRQRNGRAVTNL
jgi:DNA-binding MarR family transcriptional regulator